MVLEEGENSGGSDTCLHSLGLGGVGEQKGTLGLRSVKGRVELGSGKQRGVKASEEGSGLPPGATGPSGQLSFQVPAAQRHCPVEAYRSFQNQPSLTSFGEGKDG